MKSILVTSYIDPDLDGTAGAMAYAEYLQKIGRNAEVGIMGELQVEAEYVFKRFGIKKPMIISDTIDYDEVVLVDASHLSFFDGKLKAENVTEIIEHRKVNEAEKFPNARLQIEMVGSACTLVAEKFIKDSLEISKELAILLGSAIISNTLNFQASNCTDRDREAFKWLNRTAVLGDMYWRELFLAKSDVSGPKLHERIVSDFARYTIGGREFGIAQVEIIGVKELVEKRWEEILTILKRIKIEKNLDDVFINILDLECHEKYNMAVGKDTKNLLEKVLGGKFIRELMVDEKAIMRKQIVSMLKDHLEK